MRTALLLLLLAVLTIAPAAAAWAQTVPALPHPTEPLEPRQAARSGYAPQGIRLGAVHLYPEAVAERVLREESFQRLDAPGQREWITRAEGHLRAEARGGPWAAVARGDVAQAWGPRIFVGDGSEGGASLDLKLGIGRLAVAQAEVGWQHRLEPRVAPLSAEQAAEPVPLQVTTAGLGLRSERGPFTATLHAGLQHLAFEDVPRLGLEDAPGSLSTIRNDDRDRTVATLAGEVAWRPGGLSAVYLRGSVGGIDYDRDADDFGRNRDAQTLKALAGVAYGRPETWRIFLEAGPMSRTGSDPGLEDVSALAVNAGITMALTPLVTARVLGQSMIAEATEQDTAAVVVRRGLLEVEHEALRNVILLTTAEASLHEYIGSRREDLAFSYGSGVRWRLGRALRVELMMRQDQLLADVESDSYQATETTLGIAARF